ncbi:MAG: hypothetical protein LBQ22_05345 [Bacteroidales bacterium]|jgi:hypothetical protein|nr:hypothetical protein [Bacteroidales bacterium]
MLSKHKKIWIIAGSIFLFVLLIAFGIISYLFNNIENKAYAFLAEEVEKSSKGLYHLEIGNMKIRIFEKKIKLYDVKFSYDEKVLDSLKNQNAEPAFIYDLKVRQIDIQVNNIMDAIRRRAYDIHYFTVDKPDLDIFKNDVKDADKDTIRTFDKLLPDFIHKLSFDNVLVKNFNLGYAYMKENDTIHYTIENCRLDIKKLRLDSTTNIHKKLPEFDEFILNLGKFNYELVNYDLAFKNISLDLADSSLHIDTVNVIPHYAKTEFAYIAKVPARVELVCNDIDVANFDFKELAYNKLLSADSINIYNIVVNSYKNKNIPPTPKVKPLFQHIIQQLPIKIDIPLINVNNAYARHEELALGRTQSGYIEFSNMNAQIKDLTNIISEPDQYFTFEGEGVLMKTGNVSISLLLPVDPENELFTIKGHLSDLNMAEVNTITEPAANISITSGKVNNLYFNMNGNNTNASIDMLMLYDDFAIALMTGDNTRKKWVLSELANGLVLEGRNPDSKGVERNVRASVKRNFYLAHFNYLWIALFEGIKESIGFTAQKQALISNFQKNNDNKKKIDQQTVNETINKFNDKNDERLKNKEERQKRKNIRKRNVNKIKNAGKKE